MTSESLCACSSSTHSKKKNPRNVPHHGVCQFAARPKLQNTRIVPATYAPMMPPGAHGGTGGNPPAYCPKIKYCTPKKIIEVANNTRPIFASASMALAQFRNAIFSNFIRGNFLQPSVPGKIATFKDSDRPVQTDP